MDYVHLVDSDDSSGTDTDGEILQELEEDILIVYTMMMVACNTHNMFNPNKFEEGGQTTVNHNVGVTDILSRMREVPVLFKVLTNFEVREFDELSSLVCPTINDNARSTGVERVLSGRPMKLTPEQRLLNFIMYLKHDNVISYESFQWNVARSTLCDDVIFIASCITDALAHEISWPNEVERRRLSRLNPHFPGCIGIIDGTLVKIRKPWNNPNHTKWFNGRKKMYCMNNTVVVSHEGLFIHLELGFPGSFS